MKFLYNIVDFVLKILNILLAIFIIGFLCLIIKWKSDTLFLESISDTSIKFSLFDEFSKTKKDILAQVSDQETDSVKEIIEVEQNYIKVNIGKDQSIDEIADELLSKRLMTDKAAFKALVHDMGLESKFKPGTYNIEGGTKIKDTVLKLTDSVEKEYNIKIEDNDDGFKVGKKLEEAGVIESGQTFVKELSDKKLYYSVKPGDHKIVTPIRDSKLIEELTK